MKAFFDIINFSTGCLFWGILIGIICMVLFFLSKDGTNTQRHHQQPIW